MLKADPQLQLETLFVLDGEGRILSTRESYPSRGPAFVVIRGASACVWAVRKDVENDLADTLGAWAAQDPASTEWERPPLYAPRYQELVRGAVKSGPAFAFPERLSPISGESLSIIHDETALDAHFTGWLPGEIAAGGAPMLAVCAGENPVSVCFCARRSAVAAEVGLETAAPFRGRGYAPLVTAEWANAVRERGLTPLYSTDWENRASLAVAHKLGLVPYATD